MAKSSTRSGFTSPPKFRSGLEEALGKQLARTRTPYEYESLRIPFRVEETKHYNPDFLLLRNGILIEAKGRWLTSDRKKHRLIRAQHPDLDLRLVFSRSLDRISKKSRTTYARFCEMQGWKYADCFIPIEWLTEPRNHKSAACIAAIKRSMFR